MKLVLISIILTTMATTSLSNLAILHPSAVFLEYVPPSLLLPVPPTSRSQEIEDLAISATVLSLDHNQLPSLLGLNIRKFRATDVHISSNLVRELPNFSGLHRLELPNNQIEHFTWSHRMALQLPLPAARHPSPQRAARRCLSVRGARAARRAAGCTLLRLLPALRPSGPSWPTVRERCIR